MLSKNSLITTLTYILLFIILLIFGLIEARNFLYPLALGVLFAYLLYPLSSSIEKSGIPRIPANLFSILIGVIIISGIVFMIYKRMAVFLHDIPALKTQALSNVDQLNMLIESKIGISTQEQKVWLKDQIDTVFESGIVVFNTAFTATIGTLVKIGLLPVYVFFILYYRNKFNQFILNVIPEENHLKTLRILEEVSLVTKKYMGGIFLVVFILCILNSIGLLIVGIKYAILFGIISALFNFIPYFGTLIGGLVPLSFTLLVSDTPHKAVGVVLLFMIIQFIENNILTPNIVGGNVRLNPFITILAIILGGMIWGIPGMFIAVPFLGMFKIACEHIDVLKPYAYLLGTEGTEKHALTWDKIKSMFGNGNKKVG